MSKLDAHHWRMANRLRLRGLGDDSVGGDYQNPDTRISISDMDVIRGATPDSGSQAVMYMGSAPQNANQSWPFKAPPGIKSR